MSDDTTKCAATMCPLFAADGSPWTGERDADCTGPLCGWWDDEVRRCRGADAAVEQVAVLTIGGRPLVLGRTYVDRSARPSAYDCPRSAECEWQRTAGGKLCPPRYALSLGLDPRACAY